MEFRILGPLEVLDGNRAVEIRGDIQRALLAILLLNANAVVATDRLIDELWEDSPPASGNTALQVRVSQLRKGLGQDRDGPIVTRAPGYLTEVGPDQLDLHRFERFVQDASRALEEGDPATASDKLRSALRLWRGPALADFGYADFARAEITRLEELRVAAVQLRIEADLVLGRHAQLVSKLRGLVLEHPAREQLRAHLMLALFRSGRQSEALAAYQDARREFIEQFGIEPSPALQELEGAILRHDPGLDRSDPQSTSAGSRAVPSSSSRARSGGWKACSTSPPRSRATRFSQVSFRGGQTVPARQASCTPNVNSSSPTASTSVQRASRRMTAAPIRFVSRSSNPWTSYSSMRPTS